MLARLHERHPDVDIVVLPPEQPPGPRPTPVSDAALSLESDTVRATLGGLLEASGVARSGGDLAPGTDVSYLWHAATTSGRVVAVGEARVTVDDIGAATGVATALATAMRAAGWVGTWRTAGTTAVFDAENEGRAVRVVRLDSAVLVRVTGRELPVATATAHRLVGARAGS